MQHCLNPNRWNIRGLIWFEAMLRSAFLQKWCPHLRPFGFYNLKRIDSMLPWICLDMDHRRRQNLVLIMAEWLLNTEVKHDNNRDFMPQLITWYTLYSKWTNLVDFWSILTTFWPWIQRISTEISEYANKFFKPFDQLYFSRDIIANGKSPGLCISIDHFR